MFESCSSSETGDLYPRWLGDIGGTNARFGWVSEPQGRMEDVLVLPCANHATLADAAQAYLQQTGRQAPACAAFGIANPVTGEHIQMTNHHWAFSVHELRATLGLQRLVMLNDFTALALAVPTLPDLVLKQIGGGVRQADAAIGVLGPGTGMGVSGLLPVGHQNKWLPLAGEGGHVTLAATNDWEYAVISEMKRRREHLSLERVVSGIGLNDLYAAINHLRGNERVYMMDSAKILNGARPGGDPIAIETMELFCAFLGDAAGNLALTLGARGGIFIGGGIVPRMRNRFAQSKFRERFEAKGRFKSYLQAIPTYVIDSRISPALMGASKALDLGVW